MTHNDQLREQIENTLIANVCALNHATRGAAAVKELPIPGTEHVMLIGARADVARFLDDARSAAREQAHNEALEEAAKACANERVDADVTGTPGDIAYNMAINHCIEAIRCLKAPAASKEGDNRE